MRIISQNGLLDMPYELIAISPYSGNMATIVGTFSGNDLGKGDRVYILAEYSTEEKAIKAMEMCREYYDSIFFEPNSEIFQFPQKRRSKMNNQQAIDRLVKHLEWGWTEETVEAIEMGIHALKETQWIPCSEKMPEESGFYMASVYCEVTKESHCRSVWFTFDDDPYAEMEWRELPSYEKVVAWMPLPEPYKGE